MRRAAARWWVVAGVGLSACAPGSGTYSDFTLRTDPSPGRTTVAEEDSLPELTDVERSTLSALKVIVGSGEQDEINAMARTREMVAADCMRSRGFEYLPATYEAGNKYFPPTPERDGEFMLKYGYGVATLIAERDASTALQALPDSEPNLLYLAQLGDSEREAYQRAFYGDGHVNGEGMFTPSDPFGGCNGEGVVAGETELGLRPQVSQSPEFQHALGELQQAWQADEGVADAVQEWSRCMSESGYDLASPEYAAPLVSDWLGQLTAEGTTSVEVTDAFGARRVVVIPAYGRHVNEVIARELLLAATDWACDEAVGLQLSRDRALLSYATNFVERWLLDDLLSDDDG